jgi:hypothetical protein
MKKLITAVLSVLVCCSILLNRYSILFFQQDDNKMLYAGYMGCCPILSANPLALSAFGSVNINSISTSSLASISFVL